MMSFLENFTLPGTRLNYGCRCWEHVRDMFKVKHVKNLVLGSEIINSCDENAYFHKENHDLCDDLKKYLIL